MDFIIHLAKIGVTIYPAAHTELTPTQFGQTK